MFELPSSSLHRAVYNVLLYSHKSTVVQGYTLWDFGPAVVEVVGYDGHIAICDTVGHIGEPTALLMSIEGLKSLEQELRTWDRDTIILSKTRFESAVGPIADALGHAQAVCFPEHIRERIEVDTIAFAPDRMRKLSLIKPGGHPIDFRTFNYRIQKDMEPVPIVGFRCGPTVRGAIAPVSRDTLEELYTGGEIWR